MKPKKPVAFHFLLFALYPVLFLYSQNMYEVSIGDVVKPAALALAFGLVVFLLLRVLLKDGLKASLITSIGLVMFFAYGHVFLEFFSGVVLGGFVIGRNLVFLPLWGFLFLVFAYLAARTRRKLDVATNFLNMAGIGLVVMSLLSIGSYHLREGKSTSAPDSWNALTEKVAAAIPEQSADKQLPDIYYIILDEYARADILKDYYGYDNSEFISYLEDKGFYVAHNSRTNYMHTYPSLASSLNFEYLQVLMDGMKIDALDRHILGKMAQDSRACKLLKKAGYTFVFFPSAYQATSRNPNADILITRSKMDLTEFDRVLMDTSMLRVLDAGNETHRQRVLYSFDQLARLPDIKEPTFAFCHFTVPHPPFMFDAEGNMPKQSVISKSTVSQDEYIKRYVDQLSYVSTRVRKLIDDILSKSDTPPVIIVQADHGPGYMAPILTTGDGAAKIKNKEDLYAVVRAPILNAYYLPNGGDKLLYDSISPVNSFRVVLNHYLGAKLELQPDVTYKMKWEGAKIPKSGFAKLPD